MDNAALPPSRRIADRGLGKLSEVVHALQAALQSFISGREGEGDEGEEDGFGGGRHILSEYVDVSVFEADALEMDQPQKEFWKEVETGVDGGL